MEIKRVTESGYIWDKRIFWGVIIILLGFVGYIFYINDFDTGKHFYFKCENTLGCENPVYDAQYKTWMFGELKPARNACDWCGMRHLPYGEYGQPEPPYIRGLIFTSISLVILGICLNHFIHNQGRKIDIGIPSKYKKMLERIEDEED